MYLLQLLSFVHRGSDRYRNTDSCFYRRFQQVQAPGSSQNVLWYENRIGSKFLQAVPFCSFAGSHLLLIQLLTPRLPSVLQSTARVFTIPRDFRIISMQILLPVHSSIWQLSIMPSWRRCHHTHYCDPVTSIDSLLPVKRALNCLWVLQLCNPAFCNTVSHLQVINQVKITDTEYKCK